MTAETNIKPIPSDELTAAAREMYFQQSQKLQQDRADLSLERAVWWKRLAITSTVVAVATVACSASLFPLKTHDVEFRTINFETGYVSPMISAKDAPAHYNDRTIHASLLEYVTARENYQYETDQIAFHKVSIMSTPDEQVRYKAKHDAPDSPASKLRDKGYVQVDTSTMQFFPVGDGKRGTHQYIVKFERRVMLAGRPVPERGEPCTALVTFAYHPEYPVTRSDAALNPWGLQVSSYDSHSDVERKQS